MMVVVLNHIGEPQLMRFFNNAVCLCKVIKIPKNTWFGINNLKGTTGSLLMGRVGNIGNAESLDDNIFDWYSKR